MSTIRTIKSIKLTGIHPVPVTIETEYNESGIGIHLVGLADVAVKESLLRTITAMQSCGYLLPGKKIVINIAPADLHKSGAIFDLGIALSLIASTRQDGNMLDRMEEFLVVGELSIDGYVRPVSCALQAIEAGEALDNIKGIIVPFANIDEVSVSAERYKKPVFAVTNLTEAIHVISGAEGPVNLVGQRIKDRFHELTSIQESNEPSKPRWDTIKGQDGAKRAAEIAVAGGHGLLLVGAPDSGKSFLAGAIVDIMPPMDDATAVEVGKIYSVAGRGDYWSYRTPDIHRYRMPHWSASTDALLGGGHGDIILPGEVSLAHGGVLHIEDYIEMPKSVQDAICAVYEDKQVVISRLKEKVTFPADFQLVLSTPMCPCGFYGESERCSCTLHQRSLWLQKLYSGRLYDKIAIQAWVHAPTECEIMPEGEQLAAAVKKRIIAAIKMQQRRYEGTVYKRNDSVLAKDILSLFNVEQEAQGMANTLIERMELAPSSFSTIMKIARTIADLTGEETVKPVHVSEAVAYRFLDRRVNKNK